MSATEHSLAQARHLRTSVDAILHSPDAPLEAPRPDSWFERIGDATHRRVSLEEIVEHVDREYTYWRTPAAPTEHLCNVSQTVHEWITRADVEAFAKILDSVPEGLSADPDTGEAFYFTPWQRALLAYWIQPPADAVSSVVVDPRKVDPYSSRKQLISARCIRRGGTMPNVSIIDMPTGSGKTASALALAGMLLSKSRFDALVAANENLSSGEILTGSTLDTTVARVAIVATSGNTFDHFVTTCTRLLPKLTALDPGTHFQLWTTIGTECNLWKASRAQNTATFWILPIARLTEVLRAHPMIHVAISITDEFNLDVPRERMLSDKSHVLKQVVLQATPQALVNATSGYGSWLKTSLGGTLHPPHRLVKLVDRHCYKEAMLSALQLCKLDLMTTTPFRMVLRDDLRSMLPRGMEVYFAQCRRVTLSSFLNARPVDFEPTSLGVSLLSHLNQSIWSHESILALTTCVDTNPSPAALIECIRALQPKSVAWDVGTRSRVIDRLNEFETQCPICMDDTNADTGVRLFGCCGYCVCARCYTSCYQRGRCAFCRKNLVPTTSDVESNWSTTPVPPLVHFGTQLHESIALALSPSNRQFVNFIQALRVLVHHEFKRTLIVIQPPWQTSRRENTIDVSSIGTQSGMHIWNVDGLMGGTGREFTSVKRRFDSPDPQPLALVTMAEASQLLVGTDLTVVDSVVTVGAISSQVHTQALGRIFRPRERRDNTRFIPMIRLTV